MGGMSGGVSNTSSGASSKTEGARSGNDTGASRGQEQRGPWGPQADYIQGIWGAGNEQYEDAMSSRPSALRGAEDYWSDRAGAIGGEGAARNEQWGDAIGRSDDQYQNFMDIISGVQGRGMDDYQSDATNYAKNDPYLQESIDSAWQQADKRLGENVGGVGGINQNASGGGNMNSSRAGVAEGLARAEAAERGATLETGLRRDSYNQGLDLSRGIDSQQMGLAQLLKQSPGELASLLSGAQGAQITGDQQAGDIFSQLFSSQTGQEDYDWSKLSRLWDMVGGNNWGGTGRSVGDKVGSKSEQSAESGSTKGKSTTVGLGFG